MRLLLSLLRSTAYVLVGCVLLGLQPVYSDEYPLRYQYPSLEVISTEQFKSFFDDGKIIVVDVRSRFEYDVLHIFSAKHIYLNDDKFQEKLKHLQEKFPDKTVVFYCNGITCEKSYKAGVKCQKANSFCLVYDSGIFEWVNAVPEYAVFFGKSPVDDTTLIDLKSFQEKLLAPEEFIAQVVDGDAVVLDIRSRNEQVMKQFPLKGVKKASLDSKKFVERVKEAKENKKRLLIFDSGGKEVQWCMYYLEKEGIKDYYFARGGVRALDLVMLYPDKGSRDTSVATSL